MSKLLTPLSAVLCAALLSACGSSSQTSMVAASTTHGTLAENPPFRIASLNAATFQADLAGTSSGAQLLQIAGKPSCGVDFYYVKFWTVGGAGETTESSGALMVPTGAAPACSGPRPVVLYAHGTNTDKTLNIADITNTSNTEGAGGPQPCSLRRVTSWLPRTMSAMTSRRWAITPSSTQSSSRER